jgi:uncharacterized protein (DUF2141 family)
MYYNFILAVFFLFTNLFSAYSQSKNVTVEFSNIRNANGHLQISLFKTEEEFKNEKPFFKMKIAKSTVVNSKMTVQLNLPMGKYGLAVLDDENNNEKMEYNMFGIPKEGFGFSNYYHAGFTRPVLSQFMVSIDNTPVYLKFGLRYM